MDVERLCRFDRSPAALLEREGRGSCGLRALSERERGDGLEGRPTRTLGRLGRAMASESFQRSNCSKSENISAMHSSAG